MDTKDKKLFRRIWAKLRIVRPLYLLILVAVFSAICAGALRQNYQTMVDLRQKVYAADMQNGDIETALRDLRQHVYSHMNTNLSDNKGVYPPIQLKYTYERLLEAEQASAKQENSKIYSDAQAHCERLHPESFSGGSRVPCIRDYVASNGVELKSVPDSMYKFDFVSPRWSPDLAGWSMLAAIVFTVALVIRLAVPQIIKKLRI